MRVLMFGWEYPPHNSGGLGVACQGLSRALTDKSVEVLFVLPKKVNVSDDKVQVLFANSTRIKVKTVRSLLVPYLNSSSYTSIRSLHGKAIYGNTLLEEVLRYGEAAKDIAHEERFDVIHAHDWLSYAAGITAKEVSGKPLIVHVHATEFDRSGGSINKEVYELEKEGMEKADKVVTVSQFTKDLVSEKYGIPQEKIEVVHNGIDVHELPEPIGVVSGLAEIKKRGYKIVLFIGRITLQKGPDYFVHTAKKVLDYFPKVYFVIAGSGDMENQVMEEAARLGISDKVLFVGFLRGTERTAAYKYSDLFVMPSVSEPFGITPLESLILGTPVLISKQSGCSEVLNHVLKADFWDVDEMTDKILSVLEHDSLKLALSLDGSGDAKLCTWEKAADKCIDVYSSVVT
jgi:glycosyltransferase involved in cell wall biosynthesis